MRAHALTDVRNEYMAETKPCRVYIKSNSDCALRDMSKKKAPRKHWKVSRSMRRCKSKAVSSVKANANMKPNTATPILVATPKAIRIEIVRVRKSPSARIEHHFFPGNVIKRFIVLENATYRELLDKPRKTEIEKYEGLYDPELIIRTSTLMLKDLFALIKQTKDEITASKPKRQCKPRIPGKMVTPADFEGAASGKLIFAGMREGREFCVELLDDNGQLRRISAKDLARAVSAAGVSIGQRIHVLPVGSHTVSITEKHTGSCGDDKNNYRCSRKLYLVTKEEDLPHEQAHSGREHSA